MQTALYTEGDVYKILMAGFTTIQSGRIYKNAGRSFTVTSRSNTKLASGVPAR